MSLHICRKVEAWDACAVARIYVAAWRTAYAGLMPEEFLAALDPARIQSSWEQLTHEWQSQVIEWEGWVVGFSLFGALRDADAPTDTAEVIAINIDPTYWRRGLGRALLDASLDCLCRSGFFEATLWVVAANHRARRFYEALGWRTDGAERNNCDLTGFSICEVRYRKGLQKRLER